MQDIILLCVKYYYFFLHSGNIYRVFTICQAVLQNAGEAAERSLFLYISDFKMHIFSHFNIAKIKMYLTIVVSQKNGCARTHALKFAECQCLGRKSQRQ